MTTSSNTFLKGLKDFVAGSVGGFVCKTVEYPLDTVKVILQTSTQKPQGVVRTFRAVLQSYGVRGLYKGLSSPLLGSMAENAVLFSVFGAARSFTSHALPEMQHTFLPIVVSGLASGVAVTAVVTPVELVKCRMQVQSNPGQPQLYRSTLDCLVQTVRREGLRQGLFKGAGATLLRELPGNVAWFGAYETLCAAMVPVGGSKDDLKVHQLMFAGGVSGMAYWTAFFPADTVKSVLQTDPARARLGFWRVFTDMAREGGVRALYRGWLLTVSRAMPSNALLFLTFEMTEKLLRHV